MSDKSAIEWTDATWPVVQGCDYESPGCANCYAVPLIHRLAHNPNPKISLPLAGLVEPRNGHLRWTGKVACRDDRLGWPLQWKKPRMIFVPSHGDLFHEDVPDKFICQVFKVMGQARQHTFQVLTKRAARMQKFMREQTNAHALRSLEEPDFCVHWPYPNVWLGVSVEDQQRADERIPLLAQTPAAVRFLSVEPMLGPVDLSKPLDVYQRTDPGYADNGCGGWYRYSNAPAVDWVIIGCESNGRKVGRLGTDQPHEWWAWALQIVAQCKAAGVAAFVKQVPLGDTVSHDPEHWHCDLRVREFPVAAS